MAHESLMTEMSNGSLTVQKEAQSISGTLLIFDDKTPHSAVPVQLVILSPDGKGESVVIATTLSDENGKYRFINLTPGRYQMRCYTLNGYIYYGFDYPSLALGEMIQVERGKTLKISIFTLLLSKQG